MNTDSWNCRLCDSDRFQVLFDLGELPIAHRFLETADEAEERFPLRIDYCEACGLAQIQDPVPPEILYRDYNYCFTSWKPEPHREHQMERLFQLIRPETKIFEIGSNDGLFMELLREQGYPNAIGLEPNGPAASQARARGFQVYQEFLGEDLAERVLGEHGKFGAVVGRQVLEHVMDLKLFFQFAREILDDDGILFIDVPDVEPLLRSGDISLAWDEHVNYFTEPSLRKAFSNHGFEIVDFEKYNFSGGCLSVMARKRQLNPASKEPSDNPLSAIMESFGSRSREVAVAIRSLLENVRSQGGQAWIYGTGCRTCALVNGFDLGSLLSGAVDDQVERQGKFLPGARLPILDPVDALKDGNGVVLLAVNQENEGKVVERASAAEIGDYRFVSVLGPGDLIARLDAAPAE